ncbi:MAG: hypothetical protein JJW00_03270 [Sulfurimonas sp.]|nr:hypothetical protein [Sulfurimonas sp.]
MNINTNMPSISTNQASGAIKSNFTEKISKEEASEIKEKINQQSHEMMLSSTVIQSAIAGKKDDFASQYKEFQSFLSDVGYEGKPIAELSQDEASELVSEDGLFGIKQTSQRIADFVINGAGGDEDRFRAGREGMLLGFKQAEEMWGGKLPEISQKTMQATIEMVDKAMHEAGFSILDKEA